VIVSLPSGYDRNATTGNLRDDLLALSTRMDKVLETQAQVLKAFETSGAIAP
jgi:hypothetical protein